MSASALAAALGQGAPSGDTGGPILGAIQTIMEYGGTVAFAMSGAFVALNRRLDLVGVIVLGAIVSVGGGTIRDLLVGESPVFWISSPTFVVVGAAAAVATIPLGRIGALDALDRYRIVLLLDAAGLALFVVVGTNVALDAGAHPVAAAIVGVISGIGGGILRDLLAGMVPAVLTNGELYATVGFGGAVLYIVLLELDASPRAVFWIPVVAIFAVRVVAILTGVTLPRVDDLGRKL